MAIVDGKSLTFALEKDIAKEPDVHRYGLLRGETIFIASKPSL